MTAETLARALSGRKTGGTWMARCPAHDDRQPSLAIRDSLNGRVLVRCHAGCRQDEVIAALRSRDLWGTEPGELQAARPVAGRIAANTVGDDEARRTDAALALWRAARPADETPVAAYLASRGLHRDPPGALRYHPHLKHPSGGVWPAMIALVTRGTDGVPLAVHRTFLARDGSGKAPVVPQKMMLGPCGGGAVRLGGAGDTLMVGEGIETCLAAMQATGRPAWAALSTAGLRTLDLPDDVDDIIVLADGDDPGESAARVCARRWRREGRRVRIARPPQGKDFNDLLLASAPRIEEGAR